MLKPITTRTHGIIDLAFAGTLIALPLLFRWNGRAARLAIGAGLATLGVSLMTNYELGLVDLIPMKAHLGIDGAENSMLLSAPKIVAEDQRGASRVLQALGAFGSVVGALTKTQSSLETRERKLLEAEGRL